MDNSSKVVFALLAGAAAGAIIGLLVAPESGEDFRKKLAKSAEKFNENLKSTVSDLAEKGQKALKDISDTVEDIKKISEEQFNKPNNN